MAFSVVVVVDVVAHTILEGAGGGGGEEIGKENVKVCKPKCLPDHSEARCRRNCLPSSAKLFGNVMDRNYFHQQGNVGVAPKVGAQGLGQPQSSFNFLFGGNQDGSGRFEVDQQPQQQSTSQSTPPPIPHCVGPIVTPEMLREVTQLSNVLNQLRPLWESHNSLLPGASLLAGQNASHHGSPLKSSSNAFEPIKLGMNAISPFPLTNPLDSNSGLIQNVLGNTQPDNGFSVLAETALILSRFYRMAESSDNSQLLHRPMGADPALPQAWTSRRIFGPLPSLLPPPPPPPPGYTANVVPPSMSPRVLLNALASSCQRQHCPLCGACYPSKSLLKAHLSTHMNRKHVCGEPGCEWRFLERTQLHYHQAAVHNIGSTYQCNICHKGFGYMSAFVRHLDHHIRKKTLVCKYCGKRYMKPNFLKKHVAKHRRQRQLERRIAKNVNHLGA